MGVNDDDARVAVMDVDQRAVDVLLRLARVDVDLVVGALGAGAVPAGLLQRLDDALVVCGLRGAAQTSLLLYRDRRRLALVGLLAVTGRLLLAGGARLTWTRAEQNESRYLPTKPLCVGLSKTSCFSLLLS